MNGSIIIVYTDGSKTERPFDTANQKAIDTFLNRMREQRESYRAMGVREIVFQITPRYQEIWPV